MQGEESAIAKLKVGRSRVHGRGVYANAPFRKGARIIEYTGRHVPWSEAQKRQPRDSVHPYHTFLFSLDDGDVIDAGVGGNEARWINHSCDPNCEAAEKQNRVFIYALRALRSGEELFYDYKLEPAERRTKRLEKEFKCFCGTVKCRGTMLRPG